MHVADADADDARSLIECVLSGNGVQDGAEAITVWHLEVDDVRPPEPAPALPTAGVAGRAATSRAAATTVDATSQAGKLLRLVHDHDGEGLTTAQATDVMRTWWPNISRNQVATRMGQLRSAMLVGRRLHDGLLTCDDLVSGYRTAPTDDRGNRGALWWCTLDGHTTASGITLDT